MGSRKPSIIWGFFTKEDGEKAKCNICQTLISCTKGNTANAKNHLQSQHRKKFKEYETRVKEQNSSQNGKVQQSLTSFLQPSSVEKYKKDCSRHILLNTTVAKMLAKDMRPTSMVDDMGFRELVKTLDPQIRDAQSIDIFTVHHPKQF